MTVVGAALRMARLGRRRRVPGEAPPGPGELAGSAGVVGSAGVAGSAPLAGSSGPTLPVGRDGEGLTRWQAARAEHRLAALHPGPRRAVASALAAARPDVRPHLRRALAAGRPAGQVLGLAEMLAEREPAWVAERLSLLDHDSGVQRRLGARIDQMDSTTCGTTVSLVLAAQADPLLALALTAPTDDQPGTGFGARFDRLQYTVHRQSTRFWPRALGTSPWGMAGWLRRHAAGVGPHQVRLVDDADPADLAAVLTEVAAALDLGSPVPLLVGAGVPRHYVLALRRDGRRPEADWRVFEPSSGEVRSVPPAAIVEHRLTPLLGFDRLHAVLIPEN